MGHKWSSINLLFLRSRSGAKTSGLVLLLPHGYEGQGPEHSSARIERYLSLAGHDNMRIVNPSTPAQIFHLLRRQMAQVSRKPLIVFTPKSLLRHPACVSQLSDFTQGTFQEVLDDPTKPKRVKRLVFCSGHLYYDLSAERAKRQAKEIALVRIEQFYPLSEKSKGADRSVRAERVFVGPGRALEHGGLGVYAR